MVRTCCRQTSGSAIHSTSLAAFGGVLGHACVSLVARLPQDQYLRSCLASAGGAMRFGVFLGCVSAISGELVHRLERSSVATSWGGRPSPPSAFRLVFHDIHLCVVARVGSLRCPKALFAHDGKPCVLVSGLRSAIVRCRRSRADEPVAKRNDWGGSAPPLCPLQGRSRSRPPRRQAFGQWPRMHSARRWRSLRSTCRVVFLRTLLCSVLAARVPRGVLLCGRGFG